MLHSSRLWPYPLEWKGLPRTNALVYYKQSQLLAVASFITLGPGWDLVTQDIIIVSVKLRLKMFSCICAWRDLLVVDDVVTSRPVPVRIEAEVVAT